MEIGSDSVDLVAAGAGLGAVQINWDDDQNFANIAVERSSDDASDTLEQYGEGFGDLSHFEQTGNVVVAWASEPDADEWRLIDGCIDEAAVE